MRDRTKLLDWIEINREIKNQVKQNFTNTDYALRLYNQAHQEQPNKTPKEPQFADFYQPSELQKQGELLFVGGGALALGYATFPFSSKRCSVQYLLKEQIWTPSSPKYTTAPMSTVKASLPSKN